MKIGLVKLKICNDMSLLDNNYDFDAMESTIDFKVHWHDPTYHYIGRSGTTAFNLPKDIIYINKSNLLRLYIGLIDKTVFRKYITKLKEYYSIFSNKILEDDDNPFYNYFECYEVKIYFYEDTIFIRTIPNYGISDCLPKFFTLEEDRMTIKGALENDIFYNVLCEIEKGLD